MQDLNTGEIKELDPAFLRGIQEMPTSPELQSVQDRLQQAADAAIPIREHQGPTFELGEEVFVKGGRFIVGGITSKRIYLDSVPKNPSA